MTNTGKIIATASTFGAIGGSSALAGYILNNRPTELENRLTQEGFEILDINKTSSDWNIVLTDYKNATKNTFAKNNEKEPNKSEDELRNDCRKILRDRAFKETNYSLARQWCVKKAKVNNILEKNYTILDAEASAEKEATKWAKLVEEVQKAPEKFKTLKDKIKHTEASNTANIAELKKECKALKDKNLDTTNAEFGDVFDQIRDYCSIKRNGNN